MFALPRALIGGLAVAIVLAAAAGAACGSSFGKTTSLRPARRLSRPS